jgi:uncharacterized protein YbaA (DUF1428 family)
MARYVDGFVLPMKKSKVAAYRKISRAAGKVWKSYGAIEYIECVGDDLNIKGMGVQFPKLAKAKAGETVVFSWILYKSKSHRNAVNKKVMADPRIQKAMTDAMPFDVKRMAMGGFRTIVDM